MLQLIGNFFVLLQHYMNSVHCCLMWNSMFTETTKIISILVTALSNAYAKSSMSTNVDLNLIIWKDHLMSLLILSQCFCASM